MEILAVIGVVGGLITINRALGGRRRPKKDALDEMQKVYDNVLARLKGENNSLRQKLWHMQNAGFEAVKGKEVGDLDIEQIYGEYAPAWLKAMMPVDQVKDFVEKHGGLDALVAKAKTFIPAKEQATQGEVL